MKPNTIAVLTLVLLITILQYRPCNGTKRLHLQTSDRKADRTKLQQETELIAAEKMLNQKLKEVEDDTQLELWRKALWNRIRKSKHKNTDARVNRRSVNSNDAKDTEVAFSNIVDGVMDTFVDMFENTSSDGYADKESPSAKDVWIRYALMSKELTRNAVRKIMPLVMRSNVMDDISPECLGILFRMLQDILAQKSWVAKIMDASGKIPSGILTGTMMSFGAFDECLDVSVESEDNPEDVVTRGQYCMLNIRLPLPPKPKELKYKWPIFNFTNTPVDGTFFEDVSSFSYLLYETYIKMGICLPSLCSKNDVTSLVKSVGESLQSTIEVPYCVSADEETRFTKLQISLLVVFGIVVLLVILGSITDVLLEEKTKAQDEKQNCEANHLPSSTRVNNYGTPKSGVILKILNSFSIVNNTKILFRVEDTQKSLRSLHGLKVISMVWVVLGHTYSYVYFQGLSQSSCWLNFWKELSYQGILNAWNVVDTFFLLGGMIVCYITLSHLEKSKGRFSYAQAIFLRYIRLTIPMISIVGLMFLWPLVGSGPIWKEVVDHRVGQCEKSWWTHLIFIGNWITIPNSCLLHFWYVSADMQLFLAFLMPVVLLYKRPISSVSLIVLFGVAGIIISLVLMYINDLPPTILFVIPERRRIEKAAELIHMLPFTHVPVYSIGIGLGYVVKHFAEIKINKVIQMFLWCASIAGCWIVLWWPYDWNNGVPPNPVGSYMYAALNKSTWALGCSWIIYACVTGRGGIVNRLLSSKGLIPLSRLSYMVYLVHVPVIWFRISMIRQKKTCGHYAIVSDFLLNLFVSLIVSYFCHMLFEAPFARLGKFLRSRTGGNKEKKFNSSIPLSSHKMIPNIFARHHQMWYPESNANLQGKAKIPVNSVTNGESINTKETSQELTNSSAHNGKTSNL